MDQRAIDRVRLEYDPKVADEIERLRAENGRLREAFRINMLRYAPVEAVGDIDRVLAEIG